MAFPNKTALVFQVHRREPELVTPARHTPCELKKLSDIDDQQGLRYHVSFVQFYASNPSMRGIDPARVIREALAQALVFYYPLAGRLREESNRKLSVECTGEGVLFVEADADVELELLGDPPIPHFPCSEELLYDVPGSLHILNTPLLLIQVTRLKCGGFTVALRHNHCIADGFGITQFVKAIFEMACGARAPSISPVWMRRDIHTLNARDSPRATCAHPEYDRNTRVPVLPFTDRHVIIVERCFFFGPSEVSALRRHALDDDQSSTTKFDLVTACLWQCRVRALNLDPTDEVRLHFSVNARGRRLLDPPLPRGYYGNAFVFLAVVTTVGKLCERPFKYVVELVREAKAKVTREYIQSTADLLVMKGRPFYSMKNSYFVSDITGLGSGGGVDFGWGRPLFMGPMETEQGLSSYYMWFRNEKGEVGKLVTFGLPGPAMNKFVKELNYMLAT